MTNQVTVAYLGDIVGTPGRKVVQQQLPRLREEHAPDVVIANAENWRKGSGLSPSQYEKIRAMGIDGVTLGDHWHRDQKITRTLETPDAPIARPANISGKAPGRSYLRVPPSGDRTKSVFVIPVLGRIFFGLPADDPFAAVDRVLEQLPERNPIVIVEAHMEATSEKIALGHYLDGRVTAVVGSHTHVPTADARVLPRGTGFITDIGMCGPYHSIIGRDIESVLRHMVTGRHTQFQMASGDEKLSGVVFAYEEATGRTSSIRQVQYDADAAAAPFLESGLESGA